MTTEPTSSPEPTDTCRRGHPRTPETSRFRTIHRNGRDYEFWDCKECRKITARQRRERARTVPAE